MITIQITAPTSGSSKTRQLIEFNRIHADEKKQLRLELERLKKELKSEKAKAAYYKKSLEDLRKQNSGLMSKIKMQ